MSPSPNADTGFLAGYRVLDLTDHRGILAGHMLAQMGADVVQLEPPQGTAARHISPKAEAWPEGENSMVWAAYGSGKRSLVCDPKTPEGLALFRNLVARADFLIESFAPCDGRPDWIEPGSLLALNPRLIQVSITPFGLTGPKRDWVDSDIVLWAASGPLLLTRDLADHPLRISAPQAYLHAASDAVSGALLAHFARHKSGLGQHVEVSVQQSVPQATLSAVLADAVGHPDFVPRPPPPGLGKGDGTVDMSGSGSRTRRSKWPVRDGLAEMHLGIGPTVGGSTNALFAWMRESGALDDRFADWDWTSLHLRLESGEIAEVDLEQARQAVARFLSVISKADLVKIALERGIRIAPVDTVADLVVSPQFQARHFFQRLSGEFGSYIVPGDFALGASDAFRPLTPAPRLGTDTEKVIQTWLADTPTLPAAWPQAKGSAPLEGIKVLDLAWVVAGPLIGRSLADYGATVVRIDSSRRIETARLMGPFPGGVVDPQQSTLFENTNAGKLGLSLDLRTEEARGVVRDLAAWADIAVESFTPGQMDKWGLGYESLKSLNPGLIMVSTSLMGQSGPYRSFSGYGNHGAAIAGFQAMVGNQGQTPVGPFGPYTDFIAPRFGLPITLAALEHQRRTGQGCHLDVSQSEAGIQFLAPQVADYSVSGRIAGGMGNRDPDMAPHGVYRAREWDHWIAIAIRSDAEWLRLAEVMEAAELLEAQDLRTLQGRKEREDDLDSILENWTSRFSVDDLEQRLQSAGIAAHRAVSTEDFMRDPQLLARGHFVRLPHPLMGMAVIESSHFQLSQTPARITGSAPTWGRDNEQILGEILGYSAEKIANLIQTGGVA